ncbi:HAD hydrolase-like protein [Candidatus Curtissbacteria bacterium]|nr:HAD hydrolase-like protein [Candidatus Curtissbacteria bacterium]
MTERIGKDVKAVFFDHDDTLVGTIEPKWAEHKFVAKKHYGKDLKDEEIIIHWGKPFPELVCILYGTDNIEEALANNAAHHTEFPKILFDPSIPLLQHLHEIGMLTGIITATSRFSFDHDLTLHGFPRECIDYTQTADDTPFHKPDPRVFEPAIKWLKARKVEPREVIYIADGLQDMKAALGAGFGFIGVQTGLTTADRFSENGAFSVASIADINNLID